MKRYEGMFLFDTSAVRDWASIEQEVRRLCERIGANLLVCVKFDERKLAYEIRHRKRGTYVLTYFEAPPDKIADLERDIQLSEVILRGLVLRAEKLTEERLAQLRAHPAEQPLSPAATDGRRHDDDRPGGGRRFDRDRDRGDRGDRGYDRGRDRPRGGEHGGRGPERPEEHEPVPAAEEMDESA